LSKTQPVLVTGAAGFVGSWLVPELAASGSSVIGARKPGEPFPDLDCEWIDVDLRDAAAVHRAIAQVQPAAVVHLAAVAVPRQAERDPVETLRLNYNGVGYLLDALAQSAPAARLLLISTGEVYGRHPLDAAPAAEDDPLHPPNVYAASKAAAEQLATVVAAERGLDVVRVRPFNHSGPRRPPLYAESSFARQIANIEAERGEPVLRVGNLDHVRDFSDVRDVVRAYALLLEQGQSGEVYNVCSGIPRSIRQVLDALVARSCVDVRIEVDPERFETAAPDQLALVGDPAKLHGLGWQPSYDFDDTLAALLDDWRARR
jgi:GDP-4-dehydro-6-deoxy-D-mannose reductase